MARSVSAPKGPVLVLKSVGATTAGGGLGRKNVAIGRLYLTAIFRSTDKEGGTSPDSMETNTPSSTPKFFEATSISMFKDSRQKRITSELAFGHSMDGAMSED
jgi:hypothetical protein